MPETDGNIIFVTAKECKLNIERFNEKLCSVETGTGHIVKILQGNGEGGLIWKVNSMMQRNQWIDKGFGIVISILSTLITLYLTGALHI